MSPAHFARQFAVSRETLDRLRAFGDVLQRWNPRINLISRDSQAHLWERHMADSAQLWALRPSSALHWADLGSGGGFPGLVVAAFAAEDAHGPRVTLVESDGRKAAFLAEAARAMGVCVHVVAERIEAVPPLEADVLSARALAPLAELLSFAEKHRRPDGIGLFPKGETVHKEVEEAARVWRFQHRLHPSVTAPGAAVVEVGALARA